MYCKKPRVSSLWGSSNANAVMETAKVFPKAAQLCAAGISAI